MLPENALTLKSTSILDTHRSEALSAKKVIFKLCVSHVAVVLQSFEVYNANFDFKWCRTFLSDIITLLTGYFPKLRNPLWLILSNSEMYILIIFAIRICITIKNEI